MLRSRIFRRLPFKRLAREQVPALMRGYHRIYADAAEELLLDIDDVYAHGTLRAGRYSPTPRPPCAPKATATPSMPRRSPTPTPCSAEASSS
jgi:hypothetical protein